jgi:hypothetical protein
VSNTPDQPAPIAWRPPVVLPPTVPSGREYDRWAHRRGEPRVFVLLWTTFLFAATVLTLAGMGAAGPITPEVYRPAARILMITVAAGVAVLWPMFRLSQDSPPGGAIAHTIQDVFIVLLPAQAVIWPQHWLAGWPLDVILAVIALLAAWASLIGSLLAIAIAPGRARSSRALWMGALLALALAGAALALVERTDAPGAAVRGHVLWMISPLTGVYELVRDRSWSGTVAVVYREHWAAILWTAGVSLPLWGVAASMSRGPRGASGLH